MDIRTVLRAGLWGACLTTVFFPSKAVARSQSRLEREIRALFQGVRGFNNIRSEERRLDAMAGFVQQAYRLKKKAEHPGCWGRGITGRNETALLSALTSALDRHTGDIREQYRKIGRPDKAQRQQVRFDAGAVLMADLAANLKAVQGRYWWIVEQSERIVAAAAPKPGSRKERQHAELLFARWLLPIVERRVQRAASDEAYRAEEAALAKVPEDQKWSFVFPLGEVEAKAQVALERRRGVAAPTLERRASAPEWALLGNGLKAFPGLKEKSLVQLRQRIQTLEDRLPAIVAAERVYSAAVDPASQRAVQLGLSWMMRLVTRASAE